MKPRYTAKNKINGKMDVAVKDGKIFRVAADIPASSGLNRTRRTLATLVFHPVHGLTGWLLHARRHWGLCDESGVSKWMGLKDLGIQLSVAGDQ